MSIELKHIQYVYGQGTAYEKQALKDVSLEIPQGQFLGIIGHTGSGKSTLIQHFNGLIKAASGELYYEGKNIYEDGYDMKYLRSQVGLVFQYPEHQLFEVDVLTDVCFGPKNQGLSKEECEKRAKEALELVGFPEELYLQSPFELSGGQKRRAAIAGVLAMRPKVLVLDEPTAGLDPRGRDEILDQIAELHKKTGITVILVSHSMEDIAKYVDRIIVMNRGEKFLDGTPREVFAHYQELEEVGLAAPQVTYIMHDLRQNGLQVGNDVTTVEEAADDITIGQYYPANSVIHRLDPRVKIVATLLFLISLFVQKSVLGYLVATLFLAGVIHLSKVPLKFIMKGLKPIMILLLITVAFNLFLNNGGEVLVHFWIFQITEDGLEISVYMAIRLIYLIAGSSIMTFTTTPNALTDGIEKLLRPLNKVKVPVHEVAMMMSIALRFIPILLEETDKIMKAQIARGADLESGNIIQRAKAMIPILVPLFVSAFRRANDLAMAMEARCYRGGEGRTKMKPLVYHSRDRVAYLVTAVYLAVIIVLGRFVPFHIWIF